MKKKYLKYKGKTFLICYDKNQDRYLFYELEKKHLKTPSEKDLKYLYKKYNLQIEVKETKKQIKELLKSIRIYLFLILSIRNLNPNHQIHIYSNELLEQALDRNDNLIKKEKDFILNNQAFLEENKEYITVEESIYHLEDLEIDYSLELDDYCKNNNAVAYYNYHDKRIFIGYASTFEDAISDERLKMNLGHELLHTISSNIPTFGLALYEALTETFIYEIEDNHDNIRNAPYFSERICLYTLLEIVDSDSFKPLFFEGNIHPLIEELKKIIDDEEMAITLIEEIDSLTGLENQLSKAYLLTNQEYQELYKDYQETKENIASILEKYFEAKYDLKVEESETMMLYLRYSGFTNYEKSIYATDIYPKGYFFSDFIKSQPNTTYKAYEKTCFYHTIEEDKGYTKTK